MKTRPIKTPCQLSFTLLLVPTDGMNGRARRSHEPFSLSVVSPIARTTAPHWSTRRQGPSTQSARPLGRRAPPTAAEGHASPACVAEHRGGDRGFGCAVPVATRSREAQHSLLSTTLIPPRGKEACPGRPQESRTEPLSLQVLSRLQLAPAAVLGLSLTHLYSRLGGAHRCSLRPRPARMCQA